MNQPNALQKPTRLEQAHARLDSALANLETVVAQGIGPSGAGERDDARTLRTENAALKRRNDTLSDLNGRIVARLDAVITRLKTATDA